VLLVGEGLNSSSSLKGKDMILFLDAEPKVDLGLVLLRKLTPSGSRFSSNSYSGKIVPSACKVQDSVLTFTLGV